jgi:hypothetical protein
VGTNVEKIDEAVVVAREYLLTVKRDYKCFQLVIK